MSPFPNLDKSNQIWIVANYTLPIDFAPNGILFDGNWQIFRKSVVSIQIQQDSVIDICMCRCVFFMRFISNL